MPNKYNICLYYNLYCFPQIIIGKNIYQHKLIFQIRQKKITDFIHDTF